MVWSESSVFRRRLLLQNDAVEKKRLHWFQNLAGFAQR